MNSLTFACALEKLPCRKRSNFSLFVCQDFGLWSAHVLHRNDLIGLPTHLISSWMQFFMSGFRGRINYFYNFTRSLRLKFGRTFSLISFANGYFSQIYHPSLHATFSRNDVQTEKSNKNKLKRLAKSNLSCMPPSTCHLSVLPKSLAKWLKQGFLESVESVIFRFCICSDSWVHSWVIFGELYLILLAYMNQFGDYSTVIN